MSESEEGLIFVGLMFLGMGVGVLFGRADVGTLIGLGLGFIGMALLRIYKKSKHERGSETTNTKS
jgi:hypothetical protein